MEVSSVITAHATRVQAVSVASVYWGCVLPFSHCPRPVCNCIHTASDPPATTEPSRRTSTSDKGFHISYLPQRLWNPSLSNCEQLLKVPHEVNMHINSHLKVKKKVTSPSCGPLKCFAFMDIYFLPFFLSLPESVKNMDSGTLASWESGWRQTFSIPRTHMVGMKGAGGIMTSILTLRLKGLQTLKKSRHTSVQTCTRIAYLQDSSYLDVENT